MPFDDVLPPDLYERLLYALDPLTLYANERLQVTDFLLNGYEHNATIDEVEQHYVLEELWAHPEVFEDYLRENPDHLTLDELAILGTWKNPLSAVFVVFERAGETLFMGDGYLFKVCGLARPIAEDLYPLPCPVHATLLPFEGRIVYDGYLDPMGIEVMPELMGDLDRMLRETAAGWEVVSSPERLREVAPLIEEQRAQREAESMFASLELDMNPDLQFEGHHRGALAGLSADQRAKAVDAHEDEAMHGPESGFARKVMLDNCHKGAPVTGLKDALMLDTKRLLERFASLFGVAGASSLRKEPLAERVAEAVAGNPETVQYVLESLTSSTIELLRKLRDAGGRLTADPSRHLRFEDYPRPTYLFCYLFGEGDGFVFVMPDEMLEVAQGLDFDYAIQVAREREELVHLMNVLVSMRGIVELNEAHAEHLRLGGRVRDPYLFENAVKNTADAGLGMYDVLYAPEATYLIHHILGNDYRDRFRYRAREHVFEGPLGEDLEYLLEEQDDHGFMDLEPKPVDAGISSHAALTDWEFGLPAVRAMQSFLDAHVPDGQDDYTFADNAIMRLIDIMHMGMGPQALQDYFAVFAELDFTPEERYAQKLLDMLTNMVNCLPNWADMGWSPNELLERELGRKLFFNEDGSLMKLGENDPCPCGSGRQYGDCHGTHTRTRGTR